MLKPKFITNELMDKYANREFKIGGFVHNNETISESILNDIKTLGVDYIITSFPYGSFDSLIETLKYSDSVNIGVISDYSVFVKDTNRPETLFVDGVNKAMSHKSFKGVYNGQPTDLDSDYSILAKFNDMYRNNCPELMKIDIDLYPNYKTNFNPSSKSFNVNKWNTGRQYCDYVKRYSELSDNICAAFYPITYADNKYSYPSSSLKGWSGGIEDMLKVYHENSGKEYMANIQTSTFDTFGPLTDVSLSAQAYAALIGGACGIRYFSLTNNDTSDDNVKYEDSPYASQNNNFSHNQAYNTIKKLHSSKFKYLKNYISSKYIDRVEIYNLNNESIIGNKINNLDEFIFDSYNYGYHMFSIGYDNDAAYCFVLNLSLTSESAIRLANDDNIVIVKCNSRGTFSEYKDTKYLQVNIAPGDICIIKKYYSEEKDVKADPIIEKPDYVTDELLSKYKNNKCQLFGFVGNFEDKNSPVIPSEAMEDMKQNLNIDYLVSHYKKNCLDSLIKTLENTEKSKMRIINDWDIFRETNNDFVTKSRLDKALKFDTFDGVVLFDQPAVKNGKQKNSSGTLVAQNTFKWMTQAYEAYKKLDVDVYAESNLYPNLFLFTDRIMSNNHITVKCYNSWYTNQSFEDYIDDCIPYNDGICIDYYIFKCDTNTGENPYIQERAPSGPQVGWHPLTLYYGKLCYAEFLKKMLEVHNKYPEMPHKRYIETSHDLKKNSDGTIKHNCPKQTYETIAIQSNASLISGANHIGYFLINDIEKSFIDSPLTSDYKHGETYEALKKFNNGPFKYIKDFVASKYVDCIDYYNNSKPLLKSLKGYDEKFFIDLKGEAVVSVAFDNDCAYCFIANMSLENNVDLITSKNVTKLYFTQKSSTPSQTKFMGNVKLCVKPCEICILKKNYGKQLNEKPLTNANNNIKDKKQIENINSVIKNEKETKNTPVVKEEPTITKMEKKETINPIIKVLKKVKNIIVSIFV